MPSATSPASWRRLLPFALAAGIAVLGFRATWFFCDDAFINYRYCGNAFDGHGLVWNPPPWAPVEGYTSFGWVAGLWLLWEATGLPPPTTAIPIALGAGLLLLWLVVGHASRRELPEAWSGWRPLFAGALALAIAGNHTFATWLSSGMETMVFAAIGFVWTLRAFALRPGDGARPLLGLSALAALAHLIRPDGDLLVLATLAIAAHGLVRRERRLQPTVFALSPSLVPLLHTLWRRWYYGEWQPNTWYAKVVEPWPASGARYFFCYVLEHGVWLWAVPVLLALAVLLRRHGVLPLAGARFPALVAIGTWLAHAGYYTLVVGGDHFAFRVFLQFVPLLPVAAFASLAVLRAPRGLALGALLLCGALGDLPGWVLERGLVGREADGFVRAVPLAPAFLAPLLREYDRCQAWLHVHSVNFRRATHAVYCAAARSQLPERRPGLVQGSAPGQRLVYRADAVGVVGWSLCDVAIVDGHGLNDRVIARYRQPPAAAAFDPAQLRAAFPTFDLDHDGALDAGEIGAVSNLLLSIGPALRPFVWADVLLALGDDDGDDRLSPDELAAAVQQMLPPRQMAHERLPPPGYVEALRPNVTDQGGPLRVLPDVVPLTDAELRAVEDEWRAKVGR